MTIDELKKRMATLGLEQRDSQMQMIEQSQAALANRKILCVEAPTGIGKTLAYCFAALSRKSKDETVVVSTATVALQEQLLNNDVPLLEKILGRKIKAAIAKGRRRYVCHSRVMDSGSYQTDFLDKSALPELQILLEKKRWDGEKDSLDIKITESEWQQVSTDAYGCSGGRCAYFDECCFFKARRRVDVADIVITNHSLLLSDLDLGGGVVLPEPDKCLYIIDECHHLPEKATSFFALQAAVMRSTDWINALGKTLTHITAQIKLQQDKIDDVKLACKSLVSSLGELRNYLSAQSANFEDEVWRVTDIKVDFKELIKPVIHFADQISQQCEHFQMLLEAEFELQESVNKEKASAVANLLSSIKFILSRSEGLAQVWQQFLLDKDDLGVPVARWLERQKMHSDEYSGFDFTCNTSPINASRKLKELFWNKLDKGSVLCSATIRSLGKFNDFIRRSGLSKDERLLTLALPSPFRYEDSSLFIPKMKNLPVGKDQDAHINEMSGMLPALINIERGTGTLVLFTSKKAMQTIFNRLSPRLRLLVLMQGDKGKMLLIKKHKQRVDADKPSVLFGLASFAEGLDLPGKYCEHVIIQKIPFVVPSDPIERTRSEWLEANQLNPFMLSMLPQASVRLTQYVGRLLRRQDDVGQVTILDNRLLVKFYGKQLLNNLPPFKKVLAN